MVFSSSSLCSESVSCTMTPFEFLTYITYATQSFNESVLSLSPTPFAFFITLFYTQQYHIAINA